MTFYQELQLNQAGSKKYIASFTNRKDKFKHIAIYLLKIFLNIAFSTIFITMFSIIFGTANSLAGLTVLLCIMTFRFSDFGIRASHSIPCIFIIFGIFAIGPKIYNLVPAEVGFFINLTCILLLLIIGCHNLMMSNHSILILSYLLLQGNDVSGHDYKMRLLALLVGAVITSIVIYHNHCKINYKRNFKSLFQEFNLFSTRTRWQLRFTFGLSTIMLIASLLEIPKAYWVGIAAMSVLVPFRNDLISRVKYRSSRNILGGIIFLIVYLILPDNLHLYMGIIGGFGLGLSATYGWQTTFNSFSAISIAVSVFGLPYAILLRIFNNIFGSVYILLFDRIFEVFLSFVNNQFIKLEKNRSFT